MGRANEVIDAASGVTMNGRAIVPRNGASGRDCSALWIAMATVGCRTKK